MADRFPLIVNPLSSRIEELVSGDNLDLTNSGIAISGGVGTAEQYLKSNGTTVEWDNPGDVYLVGAQTVSDKTFTSCTLDGSTNTLSNIANTSLVNDSITVNGVAIALGGSVTTTRLRAESSGTFRFGDVTFLGTGATTISDAAGVLGPEITINSTDTVTSLQSAIGGTATTGTISIAGSGSASVSQLGSVITVNASDTNTVTRLQGTGGTLASGDILIEGDDAISTSQLGQTITITGKNYTTTDGIINAFASATTLTLGATSGDTIVRNNLEVNGRETESAINNFATNLTPAGGTLTIDTAGTNNVFGTLAAAVISTWAFTNTGIQNNQVIKIIGYFIGNATASYGSAVTVDGNSIPSGVEWEGGTAPPANTTGTIDIIEFIIARDGASNTRVFGRATLAHG